MNTRQPVRWFEKEWTFAALSFLTLVTLVPAESVYEALASNPQFLGVRQVGHARLLEIVLAFNLLPVLAFFLLWGVCRIIHRRLAQAFLCVACGLFLLAFGLQLHIMYLSKSEYLADFYPLWLIPALLAGYASWHFEKAFRSFVLALSPGIILFPSFFLFRTWMPTKSAAATSPVAQQQVAHAGNPKLPPVFLVVFDEFRLRDLLGADEKINGAMFPNFQKLAEDSYWFRNATANADNTAMSVPVILTGNFPVGIDPSHAAYPQNVFTLVQPLYDTYVHEVVTHFCIAGQYHCPDEEIQSSDFAILRDLLFIYAAHVLPKKYVAGLPSMARSWGPFRDSNEEISARIDRFQAFLNSLSALPDDRTFVMFHEMMPHSPYALTSVGTIYSAEPSYVDPSFVGNTELLDSLHKRYVMQMTYVDNEVGRLITRLKQLGLYDKSLIIITADHGVSFRLNAPGRDLNPADADEILPVPLFIKTPFQESGATSDRDVQLIDVLPTMAGLLGLKVPWAVRGHSVFDSNPKPRMKIAYSGDGLGTQLVFPQTLPVPEHSLPAENRKSPLVDLNVASCDVAVDLGVLGSVDPLPFSIFDAGPGRKETSVNAFGWAAHTDSSDVPQIALAVNGKIVGVASPCCERPDVAALNHQPQFLKSGWQIAFSSRKLQAGVNTVTAYVVLDEKKRSLALLYPSGPDTIHGVRAARVEDFESKEAHGLIGSRVEKCVIEHVGVVKGFQDFLAKSTVRMRPGVDDFPIAVGGWAARPGTPANHLEVALALNGEIIAVASPCCERPDVEKVFHNSDFLKSGWTMSISSRKLRSGKNEVATYIVLDARKKILAPLEAVASTIQAKFE
jgi:hypothetical protein